MKISLHAILTLLDAIDVILEEFRQYLVPLQSDPSKFSGPTLLEIMSRLRTPLESHFVSEVKMIASLKDHPSTPAAGSPQEAAETAKFERWGGNAIMKGGITDVVVFFLRNLDRTYEDGRWEHWPPIPAPVKWMLVNGVGLLHSGYWKFASCDANGRPQALYACK